MASAAVIATIATTVVSTGVAVKGQIDSASLRKDQSRLKAKQLQLQSEKELAQSAQDSLQRERRLQTLLSRQRALQGGIVELNSGSALRLQETAIGVTKIYLRRANNV